MQAGPTSDVPRRGDGGGRLGGTLLIAAGLLTAVNNYLPGSSHLDVVVLNVSAAAAIGIGLLALVMPWERWPARTPLVLALVAFALIGLSDRYGGVSAYSYAVYFVVVFVWLGLSQPRFTSLVISPLAAGAYVWPLVAAPEPAPHGVASATVAIPVCVLVGETLARSVRRHYEARRELARRVEMAEQQRNREQAIIDAVDGLLVVDGEGQVVSANRAAGALFRTAAAELIDQPAPLPLPPPGVPTEHDLGGGRWVECVTAPLPGTADRVVGLHDITRQRALKEAQDLFIATTSHELRTPLTVVTGYLATLQRRWPSLTAVQRQEAIDIAADRADALVDLVNHLLLAARAGVGRSALVTVPFDLTAAARRIVADAVALNGQHHIVLVAGDACALGDESTVGPILGQLLENAVKYSPDGGRVEVRVASAGPAVRLEVADEGIGLPQGAEREIFTPFRQGGGGDRRRFGGVGLGLHIVRQLVEAQGGTVTAISRPGGGALFTVTLPSAAGARRSTA